MRLTDKSGGVTVNNSERLSKMPLSELLTEAQKKLEKHDVCVLTVFGSEKELDNCSRLCELCIERWLGKEADGRCRT